VSSQAPTDPTAPDAPAPQLARVRLGGWRGRAAPDWAARIEGDPLEWLERQPHEVVGDRPSARTLRVHAADGIVYAKLLAPLRSGAGPIGRLKWALRPSRAGRVLRVSRRFARAELRVPRVLLALRRRRGWRTEDLLVTAAVEGPSLQRRMVEVQDEAERRRLLRLMGRRAAEMHRAGLVHGDLLPGNLIVVDGGAELVFIDNDRSRRWWPAVPARERRRNLGQALYRMVSWLGYRRSRWFLDGYYGTLGVDGTRRRRETAAVLHRLRPRLREGERRYGRQGLRAVRR
jgi:hypothetical protein